MQVIFRPKNWIILFTLCIGVFTMLLITGCGSSGETAVSGSTITINPTTYTIAGMVQDTCVNWTATVLDSSKKPLSNINVTITGSMARPRATPHYQFYTAANCVDPGATGIAVNSGFQGQTDNFGTYTFSTLLLVANPVFSDNIDVTSGTAFVAAAIAGT